MPGSEARTPVLQVLANSSALDGVLEVTVSANSHYASDRFRLVAALSTVDPSILALPLLKIEIRAGVDLGFSSLITGQADRIDIDVVQGTVGIEGRDLSSLLIESRIQQTYSNQTSSEIVSAFAQRHGLAADVVGTTTPVGRYYQSEHEQVALDQFSRATTEWDLSVFLAQHEGFDLWVDGETLHFRPEAIQTAPYQIQPSDCIDLRLERALTLAGDIEVVVKSWNTQQQVACQETASRSSGTQAGQSQRYVYVRPNLVPDQALQLAQRILDNLSQHERLVHVTLPGDTLLSPRDFILLAGTGTDFDQVYQIAEIERELSPHRGFVQRIRAKSAPSSNAAAITGNA